MHEPIKQTAPDCDLKRAHYVPEDLIFRCAVDGKLCPGVNHCDKEHQNA